MRLLRKKTQRLRPLSETEAYARCHGDRDEDVKIVKVERKRKRYDTTVTGERLRSAFEARLDKREAEAQAAAAAAAEEAAAVQAEADAAAVELEDEPSGDALPADSQAEPQLALDPEP